MRLQVLGKLPVLVIVVIATGTVSFAAVPSLPFAKGIIWFYEGTVAWQEGTETKSKHVKFATEIIEVFSYPNARVAVVREFPSEFAWYDETKHPRYSVLILSQEGLSEISSDSLQEARRLAQDFASKSNVLMQRMHPLVVFPLSDGRLFRSRVKGFIPSQVVRSYETINRTNPDHTIVDFVPDLGVVHYTYEHHGTVSKVDVELKEIRRYKRKRRSRNSTNG
jgi:hypothetical protein